MEEGRGPDDVYLGIHFGEVLGCGGSEYVDGKEVTFQGATIEEEIEAKIEEFAVDVDAVEAVGVHAVVDELAQVLRETATQV